MHIVKKQFSKFLILLDILHQLDGATGVICELIKVLKMIKERSNHWQHSLNQTNVVA